MKLALAQLGVGKNLEENIGKALNMLEKAANSEADLICFP